MSSRNARALKGAKEIFGDFARLNVFINSSGDQLLVDVSRDLTEEEIEVLEEFELESDIVLCYEGPYKNTEYLEFTVEHPE